MHFFDTVTVLKDHICHLLTINSMICHTVQHPLFVRYFELTISHWQLNHSVL